MHTSGSNIFQTLSFMRPFGLPFVKIRKCKAAVGIRMERRGVNY